MPPFTHQSCWHWLTALPAVLCATLPVSSVSPTPTPRTIELPAARQSGGLPLMDALARPEAPLDLGSGRLSTQHLSNLLWAGSASSHAAGGGSSAGGRHATDIYVLLKAGAFVYDPARHNLRQIVAQDIRGLCGLADPRWQAPVTLVYVLDLTRAARSGSGEPDLAAAVEAGVMAQNVALYCASESLSAGEREVASPRALGRRLRLRPAQRIVAAQVVGYQQP